MFAAVVNFKIFSLTRQFCSLPITRMPAPQCVARAVVGTVK